jgi:ATP-binding protein involved in chromosome partitioning
MAAMSAPAATLESAVSAALANVNDPEIRRPITELGMVRSVAVRPEGTAEVGILLTVAGCPLRDKLRTDITAAARTVTGVGAVEIDFGVMSDEQRRGLQSRLRGSDGAEPVIPFAQPGSRTRVYAVASGKGGVGKSSVTVNLAVALAARGLAVGVVDADIYGHSIPRMLGVNAVPTRVEDMIMPPQAIHGIKVISIGMFTQGNAAVVWRGPMLHRALQQFLADVYWGELDVLLLDLPPGTGDVAISLAQLLPSAEILVVTTPQVAAAEVAERAGAVVMQTHQRLIGVVENMSWLDLPDGSRMEIFGAGGGQTVAQSLSRAVGAPVPLLGQIPLDPRLRESGDAGTPIVVADPTSGVARALVGVADALAVRHTSLVGQPLGLRPAGR